MDAVQAEILQRLARLEEKFNGLADDVQDIRKDGHEMRGDLAATREILVQAKGARWLLMTMLAAVPVVGFIMSKWDAIARIFK